MKTGAKYLSLRLMFMIFQTISLWFDKFIYLNKQEWKDTWGQVKKKKSLYKN